MKITRNGIAQHLWAQIVFALIVGYSGSAFAEPYRFIHDMRQLQLGAYGNETQLQVTVQGIKATPASLDVEIVRDGELLHAVAEDVSFNVYDEPVFSVSIASPRAGLVYRFSFQDSNGKIWRSKYFWKLQNCQETEQELYITNETAESHTLSPEALQAARGANLLEDKLKSMEHAKKRLGQLQAMIDKGAS